MTEEEAIDIVTEVESGNITMGGMYRILYSYCISKGKPQLATELFVKTAIAFGMAPELIGYIVDYYIKEYQLILLTNKEGKFIKVLKNEKINSKTVCYCEESSTEC